jgi:hypothetical protein
MRNPDERTEEIQVVKHTFRSAARAAAILAALLAAGAAAAAAQTGAASSPGMPAPSASPDTAHDWISLHRLLGASHEIDTRSIIRLSDGSWRVLYRVVDEPFTNPAGERMDRIDALTDFDCEHGREQHRNFTILLGSDTVRTSPAKGRWSRPSGPHRQVFERICAYLAARAGS